MEAEKPSQLSQINRLVRFLGQGEGGIMFATCVYPGLIREISEIIRERMRREGIEVGYLHLELDSEMTLAGQIEHYAKEIERSNALVVFGLPGFLDYNGNQHLTALNFARESLLALGKPILFWATEKKLTLIMNRAADLYSQRTYSTVFFEGVPENIDETSLLKSNLNEIAQNDKKSLELRINLLKNQREEATNRNINLEKRLRDFDLPLIDAYRKLGEYENALEILNRFDDVPANETSPLLKATFLRNRGDVFLGLHMAKKALDSYYQFLELASSLMIDNPREILPEIAGTYNNLGMLFSAQKEFEKSIGYYGESLAIWKKLASIDPVIYQSQVASVLNNIGVSLYDDHKPQDAATYFQEAVEIIRDIVDQNPSYYLPNLAMFLFNLGNVFKSLSQLDKAKIFFEGSLEIERSLAEEMPEKHLAPLASTLNMLGGIFRRENELDLSKIYLEESLAIRIKLALKNPAGILSDMANTLHNLGMLYADKQEWDEAKLRYLEAIKIYDTIGYENFKVETIRLKISLGNLYRSQKNSKDALSNLHEALEMAKELVTNSSSFLIPEIALIELTLSRLYFEDLNDPTSAKSHLQACLEDCEPFVETSPAAKRYSGIATDLLAQIEE